MKRYVITLLMSLLPGSLAQARDFRIYNTTDEEQWVALNYLETDFCARGVAGIGGNGYCEEEVKRRISAGWLYLRPNETIVKRLNVSGKVCVRLFKQDYFIAAPHERATIARNAGHPNETFETSIYATRGGGNGVRFHALFKIGEGAQQIARKFEGSNGEQVGRDAINFGRQHGMQVMEFQCINGDAVIFD